MRRKLLFTNCFYIEPNGIAGGLALWWKDEANVSILSTSKNVIDSKITLNEGTPWFCSFLYGSPYREERNEIWRKMKVLRSNMDEPWCIVGDFNIVLSQEEKFGGSPFAIDKASEFYDLQDRCGLMEMPIKGGPFLWSNRRVDDEAILEKLDRIMFNVSWSSIFGNAIGCFEPAIGSDHCPVVLFLNS
ncbi:hypothetical protein V6N12_027496 [Hibiscus sabdariffa]